MCLSSDWLITYWLCRTLVMMPCTSSRRQTSFCEEAAAEWLEGTDEVCEPPLKVEAPSISPNARLARNLYQLNLPEYLIETEIYSASIQCVILINIFGRFPNQRTPYSLCMHFCAHPDRCVGFQDQPGPKWECPIHVVSTVLLKILTAWSQIQQHGTLGIRI